MAEYIEKQAAIKAVCDACGVIPDGEKDTCPYKYKGAGCREYDKIIDIPPADVRPVVRSQWKKNDNGTYSCERCHSWIPEEQWHYANWCLYCGADMRGGDADG